MSGIKLGSSTLVKDEPPAPGRSFEDFLHVKIEKGMDDDDDGDNADEDD